LAEREAGEAEVGSVAAVAAAVDNLVEKLPREEKWDKNYVDRMDECNDRQGTCTPSSYR
jgi:hypothetical protein